MLHKWDNDSSDKKPFDVTTHAVLVLALIVVPYLTGSFAFGVAACL